MKRIGEWYWPDDDIKAAPAVLEQADHLPRYLTHVPNKGVCLQAGGNVGVFSEILSRHFHQVMTFEPDLKNWECLLANLKAGNVTAENAGLSLEPGFCETFRPDGEADNCGAAMVRKTNAGIPLLTIDSLKLKSLDFLMLDIEGYEFAALTGAFNTIARFKPVISVELKGLGDRFGWTDDMTDGLLARHGYRIVDEIGRDKVFVC